MHFDEIIVSSQAHTHKCGQAVDRHPGRDGGVLPAVNVSRWAGKGCGRGVRMQALAFGEGGDCD